MALGETQNRIYLNVSLGKLRIKCDASNPKAQKRIDSENKEVHELVYPWVKGVLDDVQFRTHEEYGNSWLVFVKDGQESYCLQLKEDSRYGGDFLRKLPNLHKGKIYTFTPYEMIRDGETKSGLSIKDDAENKIQSYYTKYEEGKETEYLHGFPKFTGDPKDKDEYKIYRLQATKFLRTKAQEHLKAGFLESAEVEDKKDDLPF